MVKFVSIHSEKGSPFAKMRETDNGSFREICKDYSYGKKITKNAIYPITAEPPSKNVI